MATVKFQGPLWKTLAAVTASGNFSVAFHPDEPAGRVCVDRF
jgi:hypothetical protein